MSAVAVSRSFCSALSRRHGIGAGPDGPRIMSAGPDAEVSSNSTRVLRVQRRFGDQSYNIVAVRTPRRDACARCWGAIDKARLDDRIRGMS